MTEELLPCKTCVYHIESNGQFLSYDLCNNPDYALEERDYVKGVITLLRPMCYDLRDKKGKCGPEGRGWVENPDPKPEYHPNFWSALKHFLTHTL